MRLHISPVATLQGDLRPPSDKSLTHRAYLFASIAQGPSLVRDPLRGEDCESTLRCLAAMGLRYDWLEPSLVRLMPRAEWEQPRAPLECGNSGTTMRLLAGLIASRPLDCMLVGDASLSRRPMGRVAEPLRQMGATVEGATPPLRVIGGDLSAIDYRSPVASAQVKSCVLLAGLGAAGKTTVREPTQSRDHTERMLSAMGVRLEYPIGEGYAVSIEGGQAPVGFEFSVPADISSAAFFMVAASILPGASVRILDLGMNPSRTGILEVLRQCGVPFAIGADRQELGEPVADLAVAAPSTLKPFRITADMTPRLIDEIPVLAVLATQCAGVSEIRGARELRVKESDRIEVMARGLRAMGAEVETYDDGLSISGPTPLKGATLEAEGDHRIAMSFAVAGLVARGETIIEGAEAIATSYPGFENDLMRLCIV